MNYLTGFAIVLSIFSQSHSAFAAGTRIPLFMATSDAFDNTLEIGLSVDQNSDATGFVYTNAGQETALPLSDLATGIVLYKSGSTDVVVLSSTSFNSKIGGPLVLTYLQNGVSNIYRKFDFALGRQGQSWSPYVEDSNGIPKSFLTMFLKAKKLFGKLIGIDNITVQ